MHESCAHYAWYVCMCGCIVFALHQQVGRLQFVQALLTMVCARIVYDGKSVEDGLCSQQMSFYRNPRYDECRMLQRNCSNSQLHKLAVSA